MSIARGLLKHHGRFSTGSRYALAVPKALNVRHPLSNLPCNCFLNLQFNSPRNRKVFFCRPPQRYSNEPAKQVTAPEIAICHFYHYNPEQEECLAIAIV